MNLSYDTTLKLHPIHILEDQKNFIVEDKLTGEFYEMPGICIHAIEMLEAGMNLRDIEKELKSVYPNEDVDIIDFVQQLISMELVAEIDHQVIGTSSPKTVKTGFLWIPVKLGKVFFNQATMVIYIILLMFNVGTLIFNPHYIPHYQDLFVFDVMLFNMLLYMALSFVLILIHELGHILSLRAVGQTTKLKIGHRLFLVVFETDMSSVWRLPAKQRNVLYLAGLCFDNLVLFLALGTMLLFPNLPVVMTGILGVIVFDVMIRVVYQCCFYLKTDLYYVFENSSGCYNLLENTQAYFKGLFFQKQKESSNEMFQGEKATVIAYGIFYLIGMAITLSLLIFYIIPQLVYVISETRHCIAHPITTMHFWDGLLTILQLALGMGLLLYSWIKKYKLLFKRKLPQRT